MRGVTTDVRGLCRRQDATGDSPAAAGFWRPDADGDSNVAAGARGRLPDAVPGRNSPLSQGRGTGYRRSSRKDTRRPVSPAALPADGWTRVDPAKVVSTELLGNGAGLERTSCRVGRYRAVC